MKMGGLRIDGAEPTSPFLLDVGPSDGGSGACVVWQLDPPVRAVSSSLVGGGLGDASWVLNATVDADYGRLDPDRHLMELANRLDLRGRGIAMMTAVDVGEFRTVRIQGATVCSTVGVGNAVWASAARPGSGSQTEAVGPGTINLVARVPVRFSDAALVNAVATVTEAKVQALIDCGVDGTGTASDALCVLCAQEGPAESFGGPRSTWGSRLARAAYLAVIAGIGEQRSTKSKPA
jgi:adenosylcobinamide hydrolase